MLFVYFVKLQENLTKDDARQQFLRILRTLPYGNSVFFAVRKIDDPIGLLPGKIVLGINKRGVSLIFLASNDISNHKTYLIPNCDCLFTQRFISSAQCQRSICTQLSYGI